MSALVKVLKVVAVLAVVIVGGLLVGWLGTRGGRTLAPIPSGQTPDAAMTPVSETNSPLVRRHSISATATASLAPAQPVPASTVTNLITDWEDRLDNILGAETEDSQKANQMLQMFPRLPEEGQVEVAQHLSNLVPDENYASLGSFLTNSTLPETVLDVLLADALNRPNSKKLPVLLDVARDPQNPKAAEAKDLLGVFLESDYGNDWSQWQSALNQWLKDNPD